MCNVCLKMAKTDESSGTVDSHNKKKNYVNAKTETMKKYMGYM